MLERNKEYKFQEIINEQREQYKNYGEEGVYKDDNWCVYSKEDDINLNSSCYIDEYPEIDDNTYEEIFPKFILENLLELVYRDELSQDVIVAGLNRRENVSKEELIEAINYYNENDNFLEL